MGASSDSAPWVTPVFRIIFFATLTAALSSPPLPGQEEPPAPRTVADVSAEADLVGASLSGSSFSELSAALISGELRYLSTRNVVAWVMETEGTLSGVEREALIEVILTRADQESRSSEVRDAAELLLSRFELINSWTLRARLLLWGEQHDLPAMDRAVHQSASRIAGELEVPPTPSLAGYAIEAVTLAGVAPAYPSLPLAELLRHIASLARDDRVVRTSRNAAREILRRTTRSE